jgi:hypothetical protein
VGPTAERRRSNATSTIPPAAGAANVTGALLSACQRSIHPDQQRYAIHAQRYRLIQDYPPYAHPPNFRLLISGSVVDPALPMMIID